MIEMNCIPIIVIIQAFKYDAVPIHTMHIMNVRGYKCRKWFLRQSGILMKTKSETGHKNMFHAFSSSPPTGGHIRRLSGEKDILVVLTSNNCWYTYKFFNKTNYLTLTFPFSRFFCIIWGHLVTDSKITMKIPAVYSRASIWINLWLRALWKCLNN
jgi:hypothetical protein